ncbi:MAG: hypothetical protein M3122_01390 [Actinomycetota bacterium]|nr:hypothetical protein [Actinomycetota bacterium]
MVAGPREDPSQRPLLFGQDPDTARRAGGGYRGLRGGEGEGRHGTGDLGRAPDGAEAGVSGIARPGYCGCSGGTGSL